MQFKQGQIAKILGCSAATEAKWFDAINAACAQYQINTKLRLAAFIAQVGHESGRLSAVSENLNYSAAGLQATWPSRFNATLAAQCARQPQKIANVVYANRMGNGSTDSGDGWNYRGRGLIQCTGKSNYSALSQSCGTDCVSNPDAVAQPALAAMSAGWFWNSKGLNSYADRSDMVSITQRINGGLNGQDDRMALYKIALVVLSDQDPTDDAVKKVEPTPDTTAPVSEQKTPAAQNSSIVEPKAVSGNAAKYPWNFVSESRSGHYTEVDDTPGAERLNMTHRTGTYWEIDPLGRFTHKSVMDAYKITANDSYDYTGGNYTQQVKGQAYRQSDGDMIFKTGGTLFASASKVQFNTGMLAVSGEINSPNIKSPIFSGTSGLAYGDMLASQALVAYDLKDGGAPMLGGSMGFSSSTPGVTGSADSSLTNNLSKQSPKGKAWVTNGVAPSTSTSGSSGSGSSGSGSGSSGGSSGTGTSTDSSATLGASGNSGSVNNDYDVPPEAGTTFKVSDLVKVGVGAVAAAAAVTAIIKANDTDPIVANAMAQSVGDLDSDTSANNDQTPYFVKHVSFDKPTLLSQSQSFDAPDPSLYVNNYHTIVDADGVGKLYQSDGTSWNLVNDPAVAKDYTDQTAAGLTSDYVARIVDEQVARDQAIAQQAAADQTALTAGLLAEAQARGAAVTAEATARQDADSSLSDLITTLTASTADNLNAAIETEQQARTDAISAEASQRVVLAAQVKTNNDTLTASITSLQTSTANADNALSTRIDAVTATTNTNTAAITTETNARTDADSALSTRIDSVVATAGQNTAAITAEATTRADADTANANAIASVLATANGNTAAILTEQNARVAADGVNANLIQTVQSQMSNGNAATFAPYLTYTFDTTVQGWTAANSTLAAGTGFVTQTYTGAGQLISPAISIVGGTYDKVRMRVKRTGGAGWTGKLYYATSGHAFTTGFYATIAADPGMSDWYILEWDMTKLTAGTTDWTSNTIIQLRFDIGAVSGDAFQVDWISVGNRNTGIDGSTFAQVQTTVSTSVTDINNVKAQYGVKVNANGAIGGFALVSTLINGQPASSFTIQADQFKLMSPSNSNLVSTPFAIDSGGNANFSGVLSAAAGTFRGSLTAATGTFAGSLSAASGTFAGTLSAANGTFTGSLSAATGSFNGGVYGGAYGNGYAWPAAYAGGGFYLGPPGLLLGNANTPGQGYLQITSDGSIYAPGMTIQNGNATFRGDIQANSISGNIVGTGNINGGAVTGSFYWNSVINQIVNYQTNGGSLLIFVSAICGNNVSNGDNQSIATGSLTINLPGIASNFITLFGGANQCANFAVLGPTAQNIQIQCLQSNASPAVIVVMELKR